MEKTELGDSQKEIIDDRIDESLIPTKYPNLYIIFLGIITLITVTSAAILHSNEQEFILDRFFDISSYKLSLFDTMVYVAYFITGLVIGLLSDKFAKRKLFILIGSIGSSMFFIFMTLTLNYSLLLFLRFVQGCFTIMVWQMLMTIILDVSTPNNRGKNMGIYGAFLAIGMGLGPMLGGFIADAGVFVPYYVASGLMVVVLRLTLFLKEPATVKERSSLKESLLFIKEKPKIIIPSLFNFIDRLHMGFIIFALPLIIGLDVSEGGLGLDVKYRGIAFAIFALPFILLQYPFGRLSDKIGRYTPLIIGSCCYGIILSLLGYFGTSKYSILLIFLVLLGILSGVTSPPSLALIGDTIDNSQKHGVGMSVFTLFGNIGIAIGPSIAGLLLNHGYGLTFLVAGILELIFLTINILLIRFAFKEEILSVHHSN
jgi:MFS family permease